MSVQATCETVINDEGALIDALNEMYGPDSAKVMHGEVQLQIPGQRYARGTFRKTLNGNYELVYDNMNSHALSKCIPQKKGRKTVNVLAQTYAKQKVIKTLKDLRARVVRDETDAEGTIKMRLRVSQY